MRRRIISILLASALFVGIFANSVFAKSNDTTLQFNDDGKFTIVQFTDTHTTDQPYPEMIALIEGMLDKYNPDLAVYTGDNVTGGWYMSTAYSVKQAIGHIVKPCEDRNIPFAIVFGNHDWQTLTPKIMQLGYYDNYSMNLTKNGYSILHRRANYNLTIKSSDGSKDAFNLWFMDTGTKDFFEKFHPVYDKQIEWYEKTSAELKAANGGEVVPSIVFQHIPVYEVYDILLEVPEGTEGAVSGNGKHYILDPAKKYENSGNLTAFPGDFDDSGKQYDSWVKTGDVVAAFFGHDHTNDYVGITDDGIMLGGTNTSGFQSRGDGNQGCRVIEIYEDDPTNINTFSAYYKDVVGGEIPASKKEYDAKARWLSILDMLIPGIVKK
ncbi:MAG: metallophosphoesterase family protein [Clostridia bacterium]|nr:metallophosphoesterase family protein [Clostridia bacterium]